MPAIDPNAYSPRDGEPSMMTQDQRAAAALAYYKELAEKGEGRVIVFGDGSAWWVPNDLAAVAQDLEAVLTGKQGSLAGFVIAEALRVVVDIAKAEMAGAAPASIAAVEDALPAPAVSVSPADAAIAPTLSRMESILSSLAETMASQASTLQKLAERPAPEPAPEPVEDVKGQILAELQDVGFTHEDANAPGVARGKQAFINLYNGVRRQNDTDPVVPLPSPAAAVEATIAGLKRYGFGLEATHLCWRTYPTLVRQDGGYVVKCRVLARGGAA